MPSPPLWLIGATIAVKLVAYAWMIASFLHWRKVSVVGAVCSALVLNFALGDAMTALRFAGRFLPISAHVDWAEISAALLTFVAAWSIHKSVRR